MTIEFQLPQRPEHDTLRPGRLTEDGARLHMQRHGKLVWGLGFIAALAGVVVYCLAGVAAQPDADLADIALRDAIPVARVGLFLIACGTLAWVVGCVLHASAVPGPTRDEPGER